MQDPKVMLLSFFEQSLWFYDRAFVLFQEIKPSTF